jgi:hypothetical protein
MFKRFSIAELLVLTGAIALWIAWFRIPPLELAGCFQARPAKAQYHIDEYRIQGEEDYRRWFRRTISASPTAPFPGYAYRVIKEQSDLLVIPVSRCAAKYQQPTSFQAVNRLNGSVVLIRHDHVEASNAAQRLVVPYNATVIHGSFAYPVAADVSVIALPIILILVLRWKRHRKIKAEEFG